MRGIIFGDIKGKYMKTYVDILGERYHIFIHKVDEDEYLKKNHLDGYCNSILHEIVIADLKDLYSEWTEKEREIYQKHLLRHECIHAFLDSSAIQDCALQYDNAWAKNEEMVDWIAIQFPKMLEAFKWLECL